MRVTVNAQFNMLIAKQLRSSHPLTLEISKDYMYSTIQSATKNACAMLCKLER